MSRAARARPGAPALAARSLSVGYGGAAVLAGLDFALERGRVLALVGGNGSGKSTLLRTLAALLRPVAGELEVLGAAPGAFPARIAYLGQAHPARSVLPLRAVDVVRMGRFASLGLLGRRTPEDERAVGRAMEIMGVTSLADEPLDALSGGQRQRVLIAQALARGAELLLLDEPAAGLDGGAREQYRRVVREAAAAGCSAVVATHDLEEAAVSDRVMLLAQRVVAYGCARDVLTPELLLATFGVAVRRGEGGVLMVEHDHGCESEGEP